MLFAFLIGIRQVMQHRTRWLRDDAGDVPGWVLITLMTAGIVTALWIVAEPKLSSLLGNALNISGDPNGK
jgi:hypothetical protein